MRRAAVDYYLAHGKSLARTMRRMGYPASREYLCDWIDELAPGQRKYRGPSPKAGPVPLAEKMQAGAGSGSRSGTACIQSSPNRQNDLSKIDTPLTRIG